MTGQPVSAPAHTPETAARVTVDSLNCQKRRCLGPKIFQAVELPLILREDVDQHITEVEHDPAARRRPLDTLWANSGLGHALGDCAIDGAELALVGAGGNHEVISKRRELVDIKDDGITGWCVTNDVGQQERSLSPRLR